MIIISSLSSSIYMSIEKRPDEVIEFLDQLKKDNLQYCNVKKVASKLERDKVIDKDQKQQIDKCQGNASANELLYKFLCDDPAPETLKGAAKVLKNAHGTTNMNKKCAKIIEDFLGIDPAQSLEGVCMNSVMKCEIICCLYRDYKKLNLVDYSLISQKSRGGGGGKINSRGNPPPPSMLH